MNVGERNHATVVVAAAGCGKTTTMLTCASAHPQHCFLMLTYNARLRAETMRRAEHLANVDVHTFHSFAVRYWQTSQYTDAAIDIAVRNPPARTLPPFDVCVIDEAQDLTPLYCSFVKMLHTRLEMHTVLIGDPFQAIWGSRGAAAEFFQAPMGWLPHLRSVTQVSLQSSYRVPRPIARFVNRGLLRRKHLFSHRRKGRRPLYLVLNVWNARVLVDALEHCVLKEHGFSWSDVFILARSVRQAVENRSPTPMLLLENELCRRKIPTSVPCHFSGSVVTGKVVCSTFHGTKGLERPVAVLVGVDAGDPFASVDGRCSNEVYTAATRASELLVLIQHYEYAPLPSLPRDWTTLVEHRTIQPCIARQTRTLTLPTSWNASQMLFSLSHSQLAGLVRQHISVQTSLTPPTEPIPDEVLATVDPSLLVNAMMLATVYASTGAHWEPHTPTSLQGWIASARRWLGAPFRGSSYQSVHDLSVGNSEMAVTRKRYAHIGLGAGVMLDVPVERDGVRARCHLWEPQKRVLSMCFVQLTKDIPPLDVQVHAAVVAWVSRATSTKLVDVSHGAVYHVSADEHLVPHIKSFI